MKHLLRLKFAMLATLPAVAQDKPPVIVPYNAHNLREIYTIKANQHTALKPILNTNDTLYSIADSGRSRTWVHRKLFLEHLLEIRRPEFNVFADIEFDAQIGRSSRNKTLWLNTRGVHVMGNVGSKFFFETSFYENQGVFPAYIDSFMRRRRVIPGQGEPKTPDGIGKTYDFAYVNAKISYTPNKFLNATLGYGTNSFGDGYRSLILSDISFSYPYLRLTGTLGNVQYTAMWAQFMDLADQSFSQAYNDIGYNKKWGVFHFLDWNVSKRLTIGLFDAVIWPNGDSTGKRRGFDWSYMNPIIFLRPAEHSVGSSDNALIGLNAKFKLFPGTTVYGQFVLDEFKLKEMTRSNGWWANKWATQIGFRSFNLFKIANFDLQGELNIARPFTYSFRNTMGNYAHYNQSLAHPMGANFREFLGIASYRYKRWYLRGQLNYARYGLDSDVSSNFGGDIFKSYDLRNKDYDNRIAQGLKTNLLYAHGSLAFVLNRKTNMRVEATATSRSEKNSQFHNKEYIFSLGVKTSFRQFYYDF